MMRNFIYLVILSAALTACGTSYNIVGKSNMASLDGQKLYLTVFQDTAMQRIDSCEIVHGGFLMSGSVDSVMMAFIVDEGNMMPVVLEEGTVDILLDAARNKVTGTDLNERLYKFLAEYADIQGQINGLVREHDQAIMNGDDLQEVTPRLQKKGVMLNQQLDKKVTSFIKDNYDNVLGPGVFFLVTMNNPYPVHTPWIDAIMITATKNFKNDPYVKQYIDAANQNQAIMAGQEPSKPAQDTPQNSADQTNAAIAAPPTPNQLAGQDSIKD
ncbi:MAG: DUF4369 domain-containing protein [Prevotella sp.]|nr:DUF4369 domain-containing protein [Prevotella sp.]